MLKAIDLTETSVSFVEAFARGSWDSISVDKVDKLTIALEAEV
jgi:hypothetical protein